MSREVFLTNRFAIKLPKLTYGWGSFLSGLLANIQEREFGYEPWPELCPVVFSLPGGWLVVMRRAEPLTDAEWDAFDPATFCAPGRPSTDGVIYMIPAEWKADSFGKLDGRIVAIDYGGAAGLL